MRILVAAAGGEGHLGPLLPFALAAHDAGDQVLFVVPPAQEQTVAETGIPFELTAALDAARLAEVRRAMTEGDRESRARAAEIELFGRLHTESALPTMTAAVESLRPDLILREPCDYASAIVAVRLGTRFASVGISPARADISGTRLAAEVTESAAPGVTAAIEASPYLTRFPGNAGTGFADTRRYGFAVDISDRAKDATPPLVWLTMGTVNSSFALGRQNWDVALEAVAGLPIRVLASTGRGGPALSAPSHVEVVEWVGLPEILSRASLVICHGGSGTTLAALAAGVPVVVVPLLADQPANAALVESLGAGVAVAADNRDGVRALTRDDVPRLRDAIRTVLADASYTEAAQRVSSDFAARPSVAERWEELR